MKITAHISDDQWSKIHKQIPLPWLNPEQDLYVIEATEELLIILALYDIPYWHEE